MPKARRGVAAEGIGVAVVVDKTPSDLELVRRIQKEDDLGAYEALVRRLEKEAYGLAYTILGNREDARDALQESFLNLYRSIKTFRGESSIRTYFFRILTNRCRDELRKKSVWGRVFFRKTGVTEEEESEMDEGVENETPREVMARTELGKAIFEAMRSLPFRQRTIFAMKVLEQMKIREIADITELSPGTVKAHLFHAMLKMQKILRQYLKEENSAAYPKR